MATLRHIAFISPDPKMLSDFYQRAAGVEFTEEPAAQIRLNDSEGNPVVVSEQSWAN